MSPATPSRSPLSLSRTRAGGVTRPAGPIGRDGRLAPDRDGAPALARAPSRVPRALQRAKNGQRAPEARLGVAFDAPIENRAGAAFAHGDARAARHVRDDRRRRYVGVPVEPPARATRANPARTRRGPKGRAPRGSHKAIIALKPTQTGLRLPKRAVPLFPTFHVVSTSIPAFRDLRDCARAAETLDSRLGNRAERESFGFLAKGKIERRPNVAFPPGRASEKETSPTPERRFFFISSRGPIVFRPYLALETPAHSLKCTTWSQC